MAITDFQQHIVPEFEWVILDSISPTQYTSLLGCNLQQVLRHSLPSPLLPSSPNSYLGTIIHKILEKINLGIIRNGDDFEEKWQELITAKEIELTQKGQTEFLPLAQNISYYALKKRKVKQNFLFSKTIKTSVKHKFSEQWMESKDKIINGRIDLIIKKEDTIIADFKTGKIFDEETNDLKEDYKIQLKLYAYLYHQNFGRYPDRVFLIDLEKKWHEVPFSATECEELAAAAKRTRKKINNLILAENIKALATPNSQSCQFCLYRPACEFHWNRTKNADEFFVDIKGEIVNIKKSKSGNLICEIKGETDIFKIISINQSQIKNIENLKETTFEFFNVSVTNVSNTFRYSKYSNVFIKRN